MAASTFVNLTYPNKIHGDQKEIVFSPLDPRVMFFATDGGIFKSSDGSQTFSRLTQHSP